MSFAKHLLVDGSNVMHAWPESKLLLRRDRDAARTQLSQKLAQLHDIEQLRVTLVFDGRGPELIYEQPSRQPTFVHIFTPTGITADDVIEQLVGKAINPAECYVATDDRAERQTVEALGAISVSAAELANWIERVRQRQAVQLTGLRRKTDREWRRPHAP